MMPDFPFRKALFIAAATSAVALNAQEPQTPGTVTQVVTLPLDALTSTTAGSGPRIDDDVTTVGLSTVTVFSNQAGVDTVVFTVNPVQTSPTVPPDNTSGTFSDSFQSTVTAAPNGTLAANLTASYTSTNGSVDLSWSTTTPTITTTGEATGKSGEPSGSETTSAESKNAGAAEFSTPLKRCVIIPLNPSPDTPPHRLTALSTAVAWPLSWVSSSPLPFDLADQQRHCWNGRTYPVTNNYEHGASESWLGDESSISITSRRRALMRVYGLECGRALLGIVDT
ncbi:hypothetical protein B0H66DRAFT_555728 [Apodospora peruviana]|uniref:Uncharacterized protein n=1 Tax=Apodospora peruviana TaxID=516989 RepID=A0AAE0IE07_9PEZI|nr:hypothetical protein B0H66DRAFT_555728 [Apodospora peruviana]